MSKIPPSPDELLDEAVREVMSVPETTRGAFYRSSRYRVFSQWLDGEDLLNPPSALLSIQALNRRIDLERQTLLEKSVGRAGIGKVFGGKQTLQRSLWIGAVGAAIAVMLLLVHRKAPTSGDVSRIYATRSQQQAIINLADGSRVTLAPHSTLQVAYFGTTSRTLLLNNGEAYFEVAHAAGVPFIVRSGAIITRVLGTAFLVRYRAGDAHVQVVVMDGKVRTTPAGVSQGVTLTAGQIGDITDSTAQVSRTDELVPGAEWSQGRVIFHHTPVATVLETVSRWYGYQFRYADSTLGARKVTMKVNMRSSAEALADLERVLEVNLTVRGDTITLVPQPVRSRQSAPRIRTHDMWTPNREVGR